MTDERDRLEDRLSGWFQAEVRRAEDDLAAMPATPSEPVRAKRLRSALAARMPLGVAVAAVLVAVFAVLNLPHPPTPQSGQTPLPTARPEVPVIVHRYADGIPAEIAGEAVHRASDRPGIRTPPGSFLVGGWSSGRGHESCITPPPSSHSATPVCHYVDTSVTLSDSPMGAPGADMGYVDVARGPVVVRVHNSPTADCPPGARCGVPLTVLGVEEVVWSGDDVTRTAPLRVDDVVESIRPRVPDLSVEVPLGTDGTLNRGTCDPGFPAGTWLARGTPRIGYVLVFPTVAARQAVEGNFGASSFKGNGCVTMLDGVWFTHWVTVANVMIDVRASASGETAQERALAEQIRADLEAILTP